MARARRGWEWRATIQRVMTDTVDNLILDLIEWVGRTERTYRETMDAWRTSCPRLPVWEDATERGLVVAVSLGGSPIGRPPAAGLAFLEEMRPHAYHALRKAQPHGAGE